MNSEEGLDKGINPDDLISEAKQDVEKAKERIRFFFLWLQGKEVPGYRPRDKTMHKISAFVRAYAQIKGFYTNNGIVFGKWKTPNIADMKKEAIENDTNVPFFKLDKKRRIYLDRGMIRQFLANLKLRDQAIFLATLSSSQDSGDLFRLRVGDIRKQRDRERIFWEAQRGKTGVRFKIFFSAEATDLIRRYIEQERSDAADNEPLFLTSTYGGDQRRMDANNLSAVFRDAARKMGVELGNGYQNPFRPKRLRHIFRTAYNHAHVDEGYIHVFMGHRSSISQEYLEKDITLLELEYSKVEPFLTIYGIEGVEGLEAIQTELNEWKTKYADLNVKVKDLEQIIDGLSGKFEKKVLEIKCEFDRKLADFFSDYVVQMSDDVPEEIKNEKVSK